MEPFLAHVAARPDGEFRLHDLGDHLESVGELAATFAEPLGSADCARLAGRWHDIGKFQPAFQAYIRRGSGLDPEAHVEGERVSRVDHSTAGAIHAVEHLSGAGPRGRAIGRLLAYVIAGHHAGLPDWQQDTGGASSLDVRLQTKRATLEATRSVAAAGPWLKGECPTEAPPGRSSIALWTRMLFSALVDADFLDTESFMDGDRSAARGNWLGLDDIAPRFETYIAQKSEGSTGAVNVARSDVLRWCREAAGAPPGLFSLTVPTGGGKTLSSMAFALDHARRHEKARVIYVIPYTSIIEQTAATFREALGDLDPTRCLLEHHSNLEPDVETARSRLATENWDAPLIVTTSVQFFESLFASRTSRVRKLHNVANSVVVLDEVQLLPPDFVRPILDVLQSLADDFNVTVLTMTATQPAFHALPDGAGMRAGLNGVREIVPDPEALHDRMRRVEINVPANLDESRAWSEVADDVLQYPSALCIVNRRRDARELFDLVRRKDDEAIHLSALMCGAHRSSVIAEIRRRLASGRGARVISTQLVEAGVDLDFPVVFRALAGIDSIAQAAGRCNREGKAERGQVYVFVPPTRAPPGELRKAEGIAREFIAMGEPDLMAPRTFQRFFATLYWLHGTDLDKHGIADDLDHDGRRSAELAYRFRSAAAKFRMIPDEGRISVIVPWAQSAEARRRLERAIEAARTAPTRAVHRALQRHVVGLSAWAARPLVAAGSLEQIHDRLFVQVDTTLYDERVGLLLDPREIRDPQELIA